MKPEETIDFHIRWAWAQLSKTYNSVAANHGATMAMGYALLNIDKEGTPSTKLGPKMGMESTSMTRLLKSLEKQGYIERVPEGNDKRKVLVHLTPKGKKYREITREAVISLNKKITENIEPEKFQVFLEVMQQINQDLDRKTIFKKEA